MGDVQAMPTCHRGVVVIPAQKVVLNPGTAPLLAASSKAAPHKLMIKNAAPSKNHFDHLRELVDIRPESLTEKRRSPHFHWQVKDEHHGHRQPQEEDDPG